MFLGHAAPFPLGMAQMAMVLQVPVVLCFALYRGGNRYDVYLEPFSAPPRVKRAERDDVLGAWVRGYVSRLESYVRKAPENWFNFYDFWDA
jgi:predicted LPLAT superfamily acyltransferase